MPIRTLLLSALLALSFSIRAVAEPAALDPLRMAMVDDAINQSIARSEIPGAVLLVGQGDRTGYFKAYGSRSILPSPSPMTADTIFDLASLSKPVGCATSIMLLAERGKLHLFDRVAQYLPAFAANGKEKITIAQLMLHHSGLVPDNSLADYADGPAKAFERIFALKPIKTPGQHFIYSDVNYIVLGEIVKTVDGRPLDKFAQEEIFSPLGMKDTVYNPPAACKPRCAPTEKRGGQWMVGEVHDPRAYALGGVAGHAGVFSTAEDLARYCRMIINLGQLDGKRILSEATVREMTDVRCLPDGTQWRSYGFDTDTAYSSCRGDRFDPRTTFGHTGFTGTMFWIDPVNNCFFILLTNRVHPTGASGIVSLRRTVATLVGEALLGPRKLGGESVQVAIGAPAARAASARSANVLCGIDVLKADNFKLLEGRRIAILANHTSRDRDGNRLVDLLIAAKNVKVVKLFSPEHGLYGALDEKVGNTTDAKTGLPVYSLYGETRRPTPEMMEGVDTLVYDIQDVGARFYTYITTLGYCMEAAAKYKCKMIVLDRPNPITGLIVDGPIADKESFGFTAYGPLPVAHGMTIGELAGLYNGEFAVNCDLTIVQMRNWKRWMWFDQTGLLWINPSPNMRNINQAALYTGICLLEATNVSVGRGTDQPFEQFGAPWIDGKKLAAALNAAELPGLRFIPIEFTPISSKFANKPCQGVYITITDRNAVEPVRAGITIAWHLKRLFGDTFQFDAVGRLLANKAALQVLGNAKRPDTMPAMWQDQLEEFKAIREKHLIY